MKNLCFLAIMLLLSVSSGFAQSLSSSLAACYAFNGNALDPVNSINGVVNNATLVTGHDNSLSSAYGFNGTAGSYIQLPANPLLKDVNAVSFSGWIKVNSFQGNDHIIFTKNNSSSSFAAYSLITTGSGNTYRFRTYKENGQTTNYAESTTVIILNTWYHVAFTIDNTALKIYVNGLLEDISPSTLSFDYAAGKGIILGGTNELNYNTPFSGAIDNCRFYNRLLSANEIQTLYVQDPSCISSPPPVAAFTVSAQQVCIHQPVSFFDQSTNSPTQWYWQVPGATGSNSLSASPIFTFSSPGVYSASLTVSNSSGMSNNVAVQDITVHPEPVILAVSEKSLMCRGECVQLTAMGGNSYSWSIGTTGSSATVCPQFNSIYNVVGTDINGCSSTGTVMIKVSTCIGVAEEGVGEWEIFPNPVNNQLHVNGNIGGEVQIYNAVGILVLSEKTKEAAATIDLSLLPAGQYFIRLGNEYGKKLQVLH